MPAFFARLTTETPGGKSLSVGYMDIEAAENIVERLGGRSTLSDAERAEVRRVRAFLAKLFLAECGVDGDPARKERLARLIDRVAAIQDYWV